MIARSKESFVLDSQSARRKTENSMNACALKGLEWLKKDRTRFVKVYKNSIPTCGGWYYLLIRQKLSVKC